MRPHVGWRLLTGLPVAFLLLITCCTASAETIRLKNGNVLYGTVVSERDGVIELDLPELGRLKMARTEIAAIEQDVEHGPYTHTVTLKNRDTFFGALERETELDVTLTVPAIGTMTFVRAEIESLRPMTPEEIEAHLAPPEPVEPPVAATPTPVPEAPPAPTPLNEEMDEAEQVRQAVEADRQQALQKIEQANKLARAFGLGAPAAAVSPQDAELDALADRGRRIGQLFGALAWAAVALIAAFVAWRVLRPKPAVRAAPVAPSAGALPSRRPKEIPLALPGFEGHAVVVKMPSIWADPAIFVDGVQAPRQKQTFLLRNPSGGLLELAMKPRYFDPVPAFEFGGARFDLVRPLQWYEYAWIGLPIVLMFMGGALGAVFGFLATYVNARVLRSDLPGVARFLLTGLISTVTVGAFVLAVGVIHLLFKGPGAAGG